MKKYLIGLSALLAMGVAFASGDNFMAKPASYAAAGTVIGIDVGWGWANNYLDEDFLPRNNYFGMVDGGAYIGYNFHPTTNLLMGVELGYKFLGYSSMDKINIGDESFDTDSLSAYQNVADLLFTAHYYVYKGWNMFGKIGVAGTFQTDPVTDGLVSAAVDESDDSSNSVTNFRLLPEYALGIGYTWNQKVDLHLTYDHVGSAENNFFINGGQDGFFSTNSIMLGISYTFPSGM
jgi:hypothetical protein